MILILWQPPLLHDVVCVWSNFLLPINNQIKPSKKNLKSILPFGGKAEKS